MKIINTQFQEIQRSSNTSSLKTTTPRYIIIKLANKIDKEKILNILKERYICYIWSSNDNDHNRSSSETMQYNNAKQQETVPQLLKVPK